MRRREDGVRGAAVDGRDAAQRRAAARQNLPGGVQEAETEGGEQARTGVVGGAAAQADQEFAAAALQRVADEQAGAVG